VFDDSTRDMDSTNSAEVFREFSFPCPLPSSLIFESRVNKTTRSTSWSKTRLGITWIQIQNFPRSRVIMPGRFSVERGSFFSFVSFGLVWFGLVLFGLVWFGLVCFMYDSLFDRRFVNQRSQSSLMKSFKQERSSVGRMWVVAQRR